MEGGMSTYCSARFPYPLSEKVEVVGLNRIAEAIEVVRSVGSGRRTSVYPGIGCHFNCAFLA